MRKKFLCFITLILSFTLLFSSFNLSYADSALPTKYKVLCNTKVYNSKTTSTSKSYGTLKKGEYIYVYVFEKYKSTDAWWAQISSGKYKNKWIEASSIDFPYQHKDAWYTASRYTNVNIRKSYSTNSKKISTWRAGNIAAITEVKKNSLGEWWGYTPGGWVSMKYLNFTGDMVPTRKNIPIRKDKSSNAKIVKTDKNYCVYVVTRFELNTKTRNWWCKVGSNQWIYLGNLKPW